MADRTGMTAVVTGASSGFGRGVAERLAAEGANVVLAARRTAVIEELSASLGPNAVAVTTDVGRKEDMEKLFQAAVDRFGRIDVWINNAGVGALGKFTEVPLRDMVRVIQTNLIGTMLGSRLALRHFKEHGAGTLINLSSFVSHIPLAYGEAYTASKFGITSLSEGLYRELELEEYKDIHVCVMHPWVTDTPWTGHAANYSGHEINFSTMDDPEDVIDKMIGLIDNPKKTEDINFKVKVTDAASNLVPGTAQKMNAGLLWQMLQNNPPAPPTSGSLHEPVPQGTEVSGGNRERLKRWKEE